MKYEQIKEGLVYGDLEKLVLPKLSIAEYEPKTGNEEDVIVIAFYVKDDKTCTRFGIFYGKGCDRYFRYRSITKSR